jgi:hypothetical protein
MRIAQINLERARFGDIGTVNENKQIIIRLYGVAFNIYIKSCQILRRQPNDQYASLVYIDYQQTPTTGDTPSSQ